VKAIRLGWIVAGVVSVAVGAVSLVGHYDSIPFGAAVITAIAGGILFALDGGEPA
jgi:hypothetical protein